MTGHALDFSIESLIFDVFTTGNFLITLYPMVVPSETVIHSPLTSAST
jgi:hypothetical protein